MAPTFKQRLTDPGCLKAKEMLYRESNFYNLALERSENDYHLVYVYLTIFIGDAAEKPQSEMDKAVIFSSWEVGKKDFDSE